MDISSPVVLARLPKPLPDNGKVGFGPTWGLRNGTKRKRHEVCAAVDGVSVNIYAVGLAFQRPTSILMYGTGTNRSNCVLLRCSTSSHLPNRSRVSKMGGGRYSLEADVLRPTR